MLFPTSRRMAAFLCLIKMNYKKEQRDFTCFAHVRMVVLILCNQGMSDETYLFIADDIILP